MMDTKIRINMLNNISIFNIPLKIKMINNTKDMMMAFLPCDGAWLIFNLLNKNTIRNKLTKITKAIL